MGNVKMISPWVNFYREIDALFTSDPDVKVMYDEEERVVKIYVNGEEKTRALELILVKEKTFGNVTVTVEVIPSNSIENASIPELFEKAFSGNSAFVSAECVQTIFGDFNYICFDNRVVQYPNDDIGDRYGLRSTLFQEIAKDVLTGVDVHFCTVPKWADLIMMNKK